MSTGVAHAIENPSKEDWAQFKPYILQRYCTDNKPLKDVCQELESRYGFVASEAAFKRRLKVWNATKYYSKDQKEEFARLRQHAYLSGLPVALIKYGDQPVDWRRVERFEQDSARQRRRPEPSIPSGLNDKSELCLVAARDLYEQTLFESSVTAISNVRASFEFSYMFDSAFRCLRQQNDRNDGFKLLDHACQRLSVDIAQIQPGVLDLLLGIALRKSWTDHSPLTNRLFSYVRDMVYIKLPKSNPLHIIVKHNATPNEFISLCNRILKVECDVLLKRACSKNQLLEMMLFRAIFLMNLQKQNPDTQRYISTVLRSPEVSDDLRINLMQQLQRGLLEQGCFQDSVKIGLAIIAMPSFTNENTEQISEVRYQVYRNLGSCYRRLNEMEKAMRCQRSAFIAASRIPDGSKHKKTSAYDILLKDISHIKLMDLDWLKALSPQDVLEITRMESEKKVY